MKWKIGIAKHINEDTFIEVKGPIILINKVPTIPATDIVEVNNPRISGSEISDRYIGNTVYKPPSTEPIMNRAKANNQMFFAKAIRRKHRAIIGAMPKIVYFLPMKSLRYAAMNAPGGAPISGITAHHAPSDGVVGISVEFSKTGRYGDVHPRFTPEVITANVPERLK